ncbi:MAG: hypothetical protein JRI80_14230 [Deltaproteobacteria bacterium]|nr:hypothetical protein [Deltaproteobacteria bacterium]
MIKTLIYINADLASSIALRYTCQLANLTGMLLQTMHVVEPDLEGHSPGTGWVRRTWEKGLLETAQAEISRLINAEGAACPPLAPPKMSIGVREDELLRELEEGSYDLFVEGLLHSYDPSYFYRKLRSRLFREIPSSILLVKNLVNLRSAVLLLEDDLTLRPISSFLKIIDGAEMDIDLLHCRFQRRGRLRFEGNGESKAPSRPGELDDILSSAEEMLAGEGKAVRERLVAQDTPAKISEYLEDYSLVVSFLPRQKAFKGPLTDLLARIPSAILLCRQ